MFCKIRSVLFYKISINFFMLFELNFFSRYFLRFFTFFCTFLKINYFFCFFCWKNREHLWETYQLHAMNAINIKTRRPTILTGVRDKGAFMWWCGYEKEEKKPNITSRKLFERISWCNGDEEHNSYEVFSLNKKNTSFTCDLFAMANKAQNRLCSKNNFNPLSFRNNSLLAQIFDCVYYYYFFSLEFDNSI